MKKLKLLERGETNKFGLLIESDAGYITPDLNKTLIKENFEFKANEPVLINCILQKYGVENRNGRIYPKNILVPQIEEYSKLIELNSATGEADHADTSSVSLHGVSHIIRKMWWGKGDNEHILYGQLEIITSPAYMERGEVCMIGDKIVEYLKRGISLGISSRGVGSLQEVDGKNLVQNDFELICFDLVTSPSTPGAYLYPSKNELELGENINKKSNLIENKYDLLLNNFLLD